MRHAPFGRRRPKASAAEEPLEEVALLRNKFLGLTKGYEYLHFQIGNIIHLRKAGIEDANF